MARVNRNESNEEVAVAGHVEVPSVDESTLPEGELPSPEGASATEELEAPSAPSDDVPEGALVSEEDAEADREPNRSRYNLVTNADGVLVRAENV